MKLMKVIVEPDCQEGFNLFSESPLELDLIVSVCIKNHFEDIRIVPASEEEVKAWLDKLL